MLNMLILISDRHCLVKHCAELLQVEVSSMPNACFPHLFFEIHGLIYSTSSTWGASWLLVPTRWSWNIGILIHHLSLIEWGLSGVYNILANVCLCFRAYEYIYHFHNILTFLFFNTCRISCCILDQRWVSSKTLLLIILLELRSRNNCSFIQTSFLCMYLGRPSKYQSLISSWRRSKTLLIRSRVHHLLYYRLRLLPLLLCQWYLLSPLSSSRFYI